MTLALDIKSYNDCRVRERITKITQLTYAGCQEKTPDSSMPGKSYSLC